MATIALNATVAIFEYELSIIMKNLLFYKLYQSFHYYVLMAQESKSGFWRFENSPCNSNTEINVDTNVISISSPFTSA